MNIPYRKITYHIRHDVAPSVNTCIIFQKTQANLGNLQFRKFSTTLFRTIAHQKATTRLCRYIFDKPFIICRGVKKPVDIIVHEGTKVVTDLANAHADGSVTSSTASAVPPSLSASTIPTVVDLVSENPFIANSVPNTTIEASTLSPAPSGLSPSPQMPPFQKSIAEQVAPQDNPPSISIVSNENILDKLKTPCDIKPTLAKEYKDEALGSSLNNVNTAQNYKNSNPSRTELCKPIEIDRQQTRGLKYVVSGRDSIQDNLHPQITKIECTAEGCQNRNCGINEEHCNAEQTAYDVGHMSSQKPNIDLSAEGRAVVPLAGRQEVAVIHQYSEEVDIKEAYDQYMYKETKIVQSEKNTTSLNKAIEDQEPL